MQAYNTSDAWSIVGLNASAVASTFSPMIFIVAFGRELTSTVLDIPERVCLPYYDFENANLKPLCGQTIPQVHGLL